MADTTEHARTVDDVLDHDQALIAECRRQVGGMYRHRRQTAGESPNAAAHGLCDFYGAVSIAGWANRGELNPVSGAMYLIAQEYLRSAWALGKRRRVRQRVSP
jgi:hypothetical protein